jgi:protease-4
MKKLVSMIGRIIRALWNTVTFSRRLVGNLLFIGIVLVLMVVGLADRDARISEGAALVLSPVGNIVEQASEQRLVDRFYGRTTKEETLLNDIIDALDYAAEDESIQVLVLDLSRMGSAGITKLHDLGAALSRFRESGKEIIATAGFYNQQQYYLAAHADKVYLHPMGQVWLSGYGVYRTYFRAALEKLLVQFHVFRVGTYKSALEPFIRNDMSADARRANAAWLNVLWDAYKLDIAALRGIDADSIDDQINSLNSLLDDEGGDAAQLALNLGLVDELKTGDEVREELTELVGLDENGRQFKQVGLQKYLQHILPKIRKTVPGRGRVGVIVAQGMIMGGRQPTGRIGSDNMVDLMRQVRDNDKIKAVVLRVNSGGGSALASEIIRREIELTRQAGKPVVVSMGTVAASGGYWMSLAANEIWASPTTITGSIGIFAALPTLDKSLDALGIHTDGVGTTQLSGAFDISRPLNPLLADMLQSSIEHGYQTFIQLVSEERDMDPTAVEKIAEGRVWAGRTAHEIGLVDYLGDLKDAIGSAAELAQLDDFDVDYIEESLSTRERLLRRLNRLILNLIVWATGREPTAISSLVQTALNDVKLPEILQFNDPLNRYALCLNCFTE